MPPRSRRTQVPRSGPSSCSPVSTQPRIVNGWTQYKRRVQDLPPDQLAKLRQVSNDIRMSYRPGCQPVRKVQIHGHADVDTPPNRKTEKKMSDERAQMVRDWLQKDVGSSIAAQISWEETQGFGATKLRAQPTTEANRRQNRRVEILLLTGVQPGYGCCPSPPTTHRDFCTWLQQSLNQTLNINLPANGIFDVKTQRALRSFQQRKGLIPSGIIDLPTLKAFSAGGTPVPPCKPCELICKHPLQLQPCQTQFDDAESDLKRNNCELKPYPFDTLAFSRVQKFVLSDPNLNGTGFDRLNAKISPKVLPYDPNRQQIFYVKTTNNSIPQLWVVFVPDRAYHCVDPDFGASLPVHVFFTPTRKTSSPYPYGREWCEIIDNYLTNMQKKLLQQRAASRRRCIFVFPVFRPITVYGALSNAKELRKHLLELVCWLAPRIKVDPSIENCTISGFSGAGEYALLPIMRSSQGNEFPELREVYALDPINVGAENPVAVRAFADTVQNWVTRKDSRIVRMYTSSPRVAEMRPAIFSGSPTRTNGEAKEWQVAQGTFVYTPPNFWNQVFEGVREKNQYIYKHPDPHQLMPCVFLQHALTHWSIY
jgi:hypothetical protein